MTIYILKFNPRGRVTDSKPTLSYIGANTFDFHNPSDAYKWLMKKDLNWTLINPALYRTTSLRAAAKFRQFSDDHARKVFTQVFVRRYDLPPLPQLSFLDKHQIEGVKWILTRSRSYLAHAPGAGKTAQAIVANLIYMNGWQFPSLFIVPPSLTANWEREIYKFTEWCGVFPTIGIISTTAKRDEVPWRAQFIICPDSMLTKDWVYEELLKLRPDFIAVDEASRFKEATSERSLALYGGKSKKKSYAGLTRTPKHVVFLDGSPMPNRPMELWAPTYALNPEAIDCMSQDEFGMRYCGARQNFYGQWEFKGATHLDELKGRLQKDFMHVVTEGELKHPERLRSMLFMNEDIRSVEMKKFERENLSKLAGAKYGESLSQGPMATHRKNLGEKKVPWVSQYVRDRLKNKNESILLFAWHREVCLELAKGLAEFKPQLVMGGTKHVDRELAFSSFQSGKTKLIVGNISAMGRGHNLQKADRIVFAEYSWTDELNLQCEKRASRRGRDAENAVRCDYIVAPHSMDEIVLQAIFTKAKNVKRVIG